MKKKNTKERILDVALDLFSTNGYEATSMSDIAKAVGIRKASLYAHYDSKQEILDSLIDVIDNNYQHNSIFSNFENVSLFNDPNKLINSVKKQVSYIVNDSHVSKIRKLFTIEQFQNKRLCKMQQLYSYDNVINFGTKLMNNLIKQGVFKEYDPSIMAAQFVLPISMWINICDRNPKKEREIMKLIEKHVLQFYKIYKK